MKEIYKYLYCDGYVVYRDIAEKCTDKRVIALAHKEAVFIDEISAADYCDYRNELMTRYGTDDLLADGRPLGNALLLLVL